MTSRREVFACLAITVIVVVLASILVTVLHGAPLTELDPPKREDRIKDQFFRLQAEHCGAPYVEGVWYYGLDRIEAYWIPSRGIGFVHHVGPRNNCWSYVHFSPVIFAKSLDEVFRNYTDPQPLKVF